MVGSGMLKGLDSIFNFFIGCFIVAVLGIIYAVYSLGLVIWGDEVIVSSHKIVPELQLTIKNNKVDTLYVYKLKK